MNVVINESHPPYVHVLTLNATEVDVLLASAQKRHSLAVALTGIPTGYLSVYAEIDRLFCNKGAQCNDIAGETRYLLSQLPDSITSKSGALPAITSQSKKLFDIYEEAVCNGTYNIDHCATAQEFCSKNRISFDFNSLLSDLHSSKGKHTCTIILRSFAHQRALNRLTLKCDKAFAAISLGVQCKFVMVH